MKFKVFDNKTGKEADTYDIALNEEWAKNLIYCDMEGFAITEDGDLILTDECGNFVFCDTERFKVVFEVERPHGKIITDEDGNTSCSECGQTSVFGNFCYNCGVDLREGEAE